MERADWEPAADELRPADDDDEVGKEGWRRGGLAVETCGLNDTFRTGFDGVGRGALLLELEVGRRGEASEAPLVEDAIARVEGRIEQGGGGGTNGRRSWLYVWLESVELMELS